MYNMARIDIFIVPRLNNFLDICVYSCDSVSEIYCTGELLRQVQLAKLFDDNKAFVDMKLNAAPGKSPALLCYFVFAIFSLTAYLTVDFHSMQILF